MKVRDLVIILIVFVCVVVFAIVKIKSSNKADQGQNETTIVDDTEEQSSMNENQKIKLTQNQFKKALEKTNNGIKITDVKLNSNANNIINVALKAENTNIEERMVNIRVTYYDGEGRQIGENGFAVGTLNKGEKKEVESTCYIENADVSEIKVDVTAEEIKIDEGKQNPTGEGTDATEN